MKPTKIHSFSDAQAYLNSFVNYERNVKFPYAKTLKLDRVETLLERLRISYQSLRVIHIAGTKGKGSTAYFCAHVLAASGFRVGLYTSPHFFNFRERIVIKKPVCSGQRTVVKDTCIAEKDVVEIVRGMQPELERLRYKKTLGMLSFFEVYTAIAFTYFLKNHLDFVVLETGLGGRLDATNVVTPLCSVITHIGYDHIDTLGTSLASIAREKAGIIKHAVPVIVASQRVSVYRQIRKRALKQRTPAFFFGREIKATEIRLGKNSTTFNFHYNGIALKNIKICLRGKYQIENASLAIASIMVLQQQGYVRGSVLFRQGLRDAFVAGRFETVKRNPLIVVDVAHNPSAFTALAENLKLYFPAKKIILIFAASRDKDVRHMLDKIKYTQLILTRFSNPRSFTPDEIRSRCRIKNTLIASDVKEALGMARQFCTREHAIVISGSLFLVSEAKRIV
ncbi:MAG: folylpolyglutamate synthase/dihydrofolate synthase family protein [Candidatus Omnitrophota bacterium]